LIFAQILTILSLVTTWIATPLTRHAASCYVEDNRGRLRTILATATAYYAACGAVVLLAAVVARYIPALNVRAGWAAEAREALPLVGGTFAVQIQLNLVLSILTGYQRMYVSNLLLSGVTVSSAIGGLILAFLGFGLIGVAAGQLLCTSIAYLVAIGVLRQVSRLPLTARPLVFDANLLKMLLKSGSSYLAYGVSFVILQSDTILVGSILGVRPAAIFGLASRVMDQIVQIIWKVPDSLLPFTAEAAARRELPGLRYVYRLSGRSTMAAALFAAAAVAFFGRPLLVGWVGHANAADTGILVLFAAALVMHAFVHSSVIVPYGANRMQRLGVVAALEAVIKVALALALVPRIGMAGTLTATLIAQTLCTGWYAPRLASRLTSDSVSGYVRSVLAPELPAWGVVLGCFLVVRRIVPQPAVQVAAGLIVGGFAYVFMLGRYALRSEEWAWIVRAIRRRGGGADLPPDGAVVSPRGA
jgi:O-antigen/teichoic acid export membrane protein